MRIDADTPRTRPCEDTGKAVTYSWGERPQRGPTATPWRLTGGLQNWEKSLCCWSYSVWDTLLCRPSWGGPRCPLKNGKRWKCLFQSSSDAWFSLSDTLVASPHVPRFEFSCLASLIITYMTGCLGFCSLFTEYDKMCLHRGHSAHIGVNWWGPWLHFLHQFITKVSLCRNLTCLEYL